MQEINVTKRDGGKNMLYLLFKNESLAIYCIQVLICLLR